MREVNRLINQTNDQDFNLCPRFAHYMLDIKKMSKNELHATTLNIPFSRKTVINNYFKTQFMYCYRSWYPLGHP